MAKKKTWWDKNKEYVAKKLINEWKIRPKGCRECLWGETMSVVDYRRIKYRLIDEFTLSDEQTEELFVRFADQLPTYELTQKV